MSAGTIVWEPADTATYSAESTEVGQYTVTVCLDDEGPLRPAYYWDIITGDTVVVDGWSHSPSRARRDAQNALNDLREVTQ